MAITEVDPILQVALNLLCFIVGVGAGFLFRGGRNGNHA